MFLGARGAVLKPTWAGVTALKECLVEYADGRYLPAEGDGHIVPAKCVVIDPYVDSEGDDIVVTRDDRRGSSLSLARDVYRGLERGLSCLLMSGGTVMGDSRRLLTGRAVSRGAWF
ncbi:hypothetical protein NDU88_013072 [Pleurodeles waltl]|uniref:Uncharacterized protein n=1 Tax=Pleurodeles waltl TaxID=8319 RepID=A0AAV7R3D6_PLEWA|nr:hypothetical protein NDU88_013072 [Pleurodeles waltl]